MKLETFESLKDVIDNEALERLRDKVRNGKGHDIADGINLNTLRRLITRLDRAEKVLEMDERALQEIYSGDVGPVILNGKMNDRVRCARRYEAGRALRAHMLART